MLSSVTTGDLCLSSTTGDSSIACCLGKNSAALAAQGSLLVLVHWVEERLVAAWSGIVGKDVKADTWYVLDNRGRPQEYDSEK